MDLSKEVLKPAYVTCNECKNLLKEKEGITCNIYPQGIPKEIIIANPFKEKKNFDICKDFREMSNIVDK